MDWFRRNPMVLGFLLLMTCILSSYYFSFPVNLFSDTEFADIDSIRTYQFIVEDIPVERDKSYRYTVATFSDRRLHLYLQKSELASSLYIGDTIIARTAVHRGGWLGNFDYGHYLRLRHIVGTAYCDSLRWEIKNRCGCRGVLSYRYVQQFLMERFRSLRMDRRSFGTLSALTLGYREDLDDTVRYSFQKAGAMHVLAVSGLHTGIVMSVILVFLTLFGFYKPLYTERWRRLFNTLVIIVFLFFYAWLTGMSPSVVRSTIMLSLIQIAVLVRSKPLSINTIAGAAFIMLLIEPTDLFSVSFQLSYSATLFIILFFSPIYNLLPDFSGMPFFFRWLIKYFYGILCISIVAQIGTMPFTLYYFHSFSNYFLLTNLLVIPLVWIIVVLTIIFFISFPFSVIWQHVGVVLGGTVDFLNKSMFFIERLPYACTSIRIDGIMVIALYGIIVFSYTALSVQNNRWHIGSILCTIVFLIKYCYV